MCDLLTDPFVEHLRSERQQRIPTDQELVRDAHLAQRPDLAAIRILTIQV